MTVEGPSGLDLRRTSSNFGASEKVSQGRTNVV